MSDEILKPDGLAPMRLQEIQEYELEEYEADDFFRHRLALGSHPVIVEHPKPPPVEPIKYRGEDGEWIEQ